MAGRDYPYAAAEQEPLIERILDRGYSPGRIRRQFHAARSGPRPEVFAPMVGLAQFIEGLPKAELHLHI